MYKILRITRIYSYIYIDTFTHEFRLKKETKYTVTRINRLTSHVRYRVSQSVVISPRIK